MTLGGQGATLGVRDRDSISLSSVLIDIQAERIRQDELKSAGKFMHTCADSQFALARSLPVAIRH